MESYKDVVTIIDLIESKPSIKRENKNNSCTLVQFTRTDDLWLFEFIEKNIPEEYVLMDVFRGLKYIKGDFMSLHNDGDYAHASLSGNMLLNDNFEGGEFVLNGSVVQSAIGNIFTFGRFVEHEVKVVKSGIRYSIHFHLMKKKNTLI